MQGLSDRVGIDKNACCLINIIWRRFLVWAAYHDSDGLLGAGGTWGKREIARVEWFGKGIAVKFEGMEVIAPVGYHEWLTQVYGNYMQLPPEEKRGGSSLCRCN